MEHDESQLLNDQEPSTENQDGELHIVYILSNPSMPGMIKIGRTSDLETRVASLSSATGVPEPFVVEYAAIVDDSYFVERALHTAFSMHRVSWKEFFRIPASSAIAALSLAEIKQIPVASKNVETKIIIEELKKRSVERQYEVEALHAAFSKAGRPVSNQELADLMGVTPGEASKRCKSNIHLLQIDKFGKELRIALRRTG